MPRCPYCDAEYTLGELYCKSCHEDLSSFDVQSVCPSEEPEQSVPNFLAPPGADNATDAGALDVSAGEVASSVPEVPVAPVPSAPPPVPQVDRVAENRPATVVGPVCPACGATNETDSKFCDECGRPLGRNCPSCQGPNRPGAKFCQHCGYRLTEEAPSAAPVTSGASIQSTIGPSVQSYVLVIFDRQGQELRRFPLRDGVNHIGAQSPGEGIFPDVDLATVDKERVISRRHAVLRVGAGRVTIADCGSTNGTFVDGKRISTTEVAVDEQSSIVFGNLYARIMRA